VPSTTMRPVLNTLAEGGLHLSGVNHMIAGSGIDVI
jgi:hypothetical protein